MTKGLVAALTLFLASGVSAQTASDLAAKYEHHEVYEVQPGVQMTAKFAANGSVCEMKVEQEHFLKGEVDYEVRHRPRPNRPSSRPACARIGAGGKGQKEQRHEHRYRTSHGDGVAIRER